MQHGCLRTVAKASFLLLQRYHRLYGLKVVGWMKQPGNAYISFYLDASVPSEGGLDLPDMNDERLVLTCYQDHVGIPAWSAGDQLELKSGSRARTGVVLAWLEEQLTLQALFDRNSSEIATWRARYTVDKSERYLLAWQLAGLLAARTGSYIAPPEAYFSDYDSEFSNKVQAYCSHFSPCSPLYGIFALNGFGISARAEARVADRENLDAWAMYCDGLAVESIADILLSKLKELQQGGEV